MEARFDKSALDKPVIGVASAWAGQTCPRSAPARFDAAASRGAIEHSSCEPAALPSLPVSNDDSLLQRLRS